MLLAPLSFFEKSPKKHWENIKKVLTREVNCGIIIIPLVAGVFFVCLVRHARPRIRP